MDRDIIEEELTQISRRGLLLKGGAAAAGLSVLGVPSRALAASQATIKVAVVTHGDTGSFWSVFKKVGSKKVLIVIHEASNSGLQQRAAGVKKVLGSSKVKVLTIPNAKKDIPGTKAKVKAAFNADKSLDSFLGLDPDVTIPCIPSCPKGTKIGTFDVGGAIKEIQAGRMLFAIDQQQYLQGYLPVVFAVLYVTNLNTVGNGQPVLTGPGIINKANAAKVASLAKKGTR